MSELHEIAQRVWQDLAARPSGPFALRFVLQPTTALLLACRDGARDARAGRAPYLYALVFGEPALRWSRACEGFAVLSRVIALSAVLDAAYQLRVLGRIYPGELALTVFGLAILPYLLVRGPVGRIARRTQLRRWARR